MDHPAVEPAPWPCLEDRLTAYLREHPQCDVDDALIALIWGEEQFEDSDDE